MTSLPLFRRLRALRAFTLIELIVVILVIGLLAGLATVAYMAITARSDQSAERLEVMSVAREAAVLAAFDSAHVRLEDFQAAFDDLGRPAMAPGVAAQQPTTIAVVTQAQFDSNPPAADRYFIYGHSPATADSRAVSTVIAPSRTSGDRCVAAAVTVGQATAELIDPSTHGGTGATLAEQCSAATAISWATSGAGAPDPGGPGDPDPEDPEDPGDPGDPGSPENPEDPVPVAPAAPAGFAGSATTSTVTLTWDSVEGADSYDVARGTTDTVYASNVAPGSEARVTYVDHLVDEATEYTYWVRACIPGAESTSLCSDWSSPVGVTTEATPVAAPDTPAGFAFTNATGLAISFKWDASALADHYEVERQGAPAPVTTTSTSHTWSGLAASLNGNINTYHFRVRACSAAGGCSAWTQYAPMTTAGHIIVTAVSDASSANSSGADVVLSGTSTRSMTIPAGVKRVALEAVGAKGADGVRCGHTGTVGTGARGAHLRAHRAVSPGDTFTARAGKQGRLGYGGWPGGGSGVHPGSPAVFCISTTGGAGGGYSRWLHNGTQVLAAGGGGGGGSSVWEGATNAGNGGAAGTVNAGNANAGANGVVVFGLQPYGGGAGRGNGTASPGGGALPQAGWSAANGGNGVGGAGGAGSSWGGGGGGGVGGGGGGGSVINNNFGGGYGGGGGGGSSIGTGVTNWSASVSTLAEGRVCISWHGDAACGGTPAPFVP